MAYDEKLAGRIRSVLAGRSDVEEKKMFGGVAFMVGGHMCVGVNGSDLMARIGPVAAEEVLAAPVGRSRHVRPMDFTGRPLRGMVYVAAAGLRTKPALARWVERGLQFVASLPPRAKSHTGK